MNMPAAQQQVTNILFPPGRVVQGDLYEPQTKDTQGNELKIKTGPNAGQPRKNFFFGYAIPKAPGEQAWWQTHWGAQIAALAQSWWPQGQWQQPRFAWKIEDGDDTTPNQNNRKNCDREGFPGHWVIQFGSSFETKIVDAQGNPMLTKGLVKRGFWVEVYGSIASNENAQNPGIYINHQTVAFRAPGKEIVSGPDPRSMGFGRAALPAGVTEVPIGNTAAMPSQVPGQMQMPGAAAPMPAPMQAQMPGTPAPMQMPMPGGVPGAAPIAMGHIQQAPAPMAVAPSPTFLAPPAGGHMAPAVPMAAAVPAAAPAPTFVDPLGAPPGYRMANQNGAQYAAFKQGGWTDPAMMQAGHMVKL